MKGENVTTSVLESIASEFNFSDEQSKKAAIDEMNNSIYKETDLNDLREIARKHAD